MRRRRIRVLVAGAAVLLALQTGLWLTGPRHDLAVAGWTSMAREDIAKLEPEAAAAVGDLVLCAELFPAARDYEPHAVVAAWLEERGRSVEHEETTAHELGDGSSTFVCAWDELNTPFVGRVVVGFFGSDWNGDEVWMVLVGRRWVQLWRRNLWF